jgi:ABC-type dipeptide/oligopeptide/nickel transport system permease subunit
MTTTQVESRSFFQDATQRFFRNRLSVFGLVIVAIFLIMAVFAPLIAPFAYDKAYFDRTRLFPFQHPEHPLGTDDLGRDYLSRLMFGARTSLFVALVVQATALIIGIPLGALAGYFGGRTDFVVSRIIDVMTAFPNLLFAILVSSVMSGGFFTVVVALSITSWIGIARLTRAQMMSLREQEYVSAARALGASQWRIIMRHIFPNALSPLIVAVTFGIPAAIFAEAGLSFLGLGVNDPTASWGKMVGVSSAYVRVYWHMALFPTLAIALTMLGFSFMGDGLRDALDPKQEM